MGMAEPLLTQMVIKDIQVACRWLRSDRLSVSPASPGQVHNKAPEL